MCACVTSLSGKAIFGALILQHNFSVNHFVITAFDTYSRQLIAFVADEEVDDSGGGFWIVVLKTADLGSTQNIGSEV